MPENNTEVEEKLEAELDTPEQEPEENEDDKPISLAEARKLRKENQTLRGRATTAEGKLQERADSELSELEKVKKDFVAAQETNGKLSANTRSLLLQTALEQLRPTMGVRSVKSMMKLIDTDALTFDLDSNTVEGVAEQLKQLKKDDPDLFISGGTDGGAGGSGRATTTDMNAMLRKQLMGR